MSRYKQPYSIFKRGKYYYYRTYTPDGVRTVAKTTGQTSKSAAKDYCDKLYLSGQLVGCNKTFEDYAKDFFKANSPYAVDRLEPLTVNTLKAYNSKFNSYILPYFGKYKLTDINYSLVKRFRIEMLQKYSASNVTGVMSLLSQVLNSAYRDRLIPVNPVTYLDGLKTKSNNRDAFRLNEVQYLYKNIPEEFKNLILLMAITGMRISEAVGVTSEDIVQADGFEYIDLKRQYNKKEYKPLKTKEAREIPITPEIKNLINNDLTLPDNIYKYFQPIKETFENADERGLCFHCLRHFFFTTIIAEGITEIKAKKLVGHSLKGMNDVYLNLKAADLIEIIPWQKKYYELITQ